MATSGNLAAHVGEDFERRVVSCELAHRADRLSIQLEAVYEMLVEALKAGVFSAEEGRPWEDLANRLHADCNELCGLTLGLKNGLQDES